MLSVINFIKLLRLCAILKQWINHIVELFLPSLPFCAINGTVQILFQSCIGMNLQELVQPVLICFNVQDARVRYYACESLYNISEVAIGAVLVFFNAMFNGLFILCI
ncbi:PREDICTED: protein VAC14 homolog [Amphimedon queenslandica]|uniref:Uncharacterized protein n=1 Tax=Amphimedon queenslandica TaxID=400682 RepID=A0AAN0J761_AMPQE|nr:PREDICTED: protein VAC14 homolog [Amphimedon queenslandica]|eukprot:XP_019852850.1 PREDICTED: protein VAC14 homolog [Amphimedon queenslandica]